MRENEGVDEQIQYSTRLFLYYWTHCGLGRKDKSSSEDENKREEWWKEKYDYHRAK